MRERGRRRRLQQAHCALPAIRDDLGGGLAGQQWVSNAYLLTLGSLILVGGSLGDLFGERRVFSLGVAGFGVASAGLRARADDRDPGRRARAPGRRSARCSPRARWRVIIAVFPPAERGGGDRVVDGVGGRSPRSIGPLAGGWLVDAVVMAADLRRQRAVRARHAGAGLRGPCRRASRRAPTRRSTGSARAAHRARPGRARAGADPPARGRLGKPGGVGRRRSRGVALLAAFLVHERAHARPDAPARAVPPAQLRGREPGDVRHVRRPGRDLLLPRALPPAGGGLQRAARRAWPRSRRRW